MGRPGQSKTGQWEGLDNQKLDGGKAWAIKNWTVGRPGQSKTGQWEGPGMRLSVSVSTDEEKFLTTRRFYSTVRSRPAGAATRRLYSTVGSRPAGAATRRLYSTVGSRPAGAATRRLYSTVGSRPAGAATRRLNSTVRSRPAAAATGNIHSTVGPNPTHDFQSPTQLQSCASHLQKVSRSKVLTAITSLSGLPVSKPATCEPASPQIIPLTCTTPEISSCVPKLARMATLFTSPTHDSVGSDMVQIRYILCQDMFSASVKEKTLSELNGSTTLKDFYDSIMQVESISSDLTLEVFSHEGYPLHPNEFTFQCE